MAALYAAMLTVNIFLALVFWGGGKGRDGGGEA